MQERAWLTIVRYVRRAITPKMRCTLTTRRVQKRLLDKAKDNAPRYVATNEQFTHVIQISHKVSSRIQEEIK